MEWSISYGSDMYLIKRLKNPAPRKFEIKKKYNSFMPKKRSISVTRSKKSYLLSLPRNLMCQ